MRELVMPDLTVPGTTVYKFTRDEAEEALLDYLDKINKDIPKGDIKLHYMESWEDYLRVVVTHEIK